MKFLWSFTEKFDEGAKTNSIFLKHSQTCRLPVYLQDQVTIEVQRNIQGGQSWEDKLLN